MRNPFKNKFKRKAKEEGENIREPWKKKPDTSKPETKSNKTIIGKRPNEELLDKKNERASFGSGYQCLECSYPLRVQASLDYPCPNCGFTGEQVKIPNKQNAPNAKKTINFSDLNFGRVSGEKKFTLVNESSPEMSLSADLAEDHEVTLGREELDPSNSSISGKEHIQLREQNGKWFIKNLSSNGATFIQAIGYMPIYEGMRVILGNRIFKAHFGNSAVQANSGTNKTAQFGQFNFSNSDKSNSITLIDEVSGLAKNYSGEQIELNRFNIDPDEESISSSVHAVLENRQSNWLISDRSSNKATFVQVLNEMNLLDQTSLILGNKVFRFKLG